MRAAATARFRDWNSQPVAALAHQFNGDGLTIMLTDIRNMVYDPLCAELWVKFSTGRRFVFESVPPQVFSAMALAPSKLGFFEMQIRGIYPCREIRTLN